jgi:hypothetical protein
MGQANLSKTQAEINRLLIRISEVKLEIIELKEKKKALLKGKKHFKQR